ncbi:hypothetical protein [Sphingobium chlorophenolicum]|uniref:hypothetical protein n=1 Tax=Sphingobium chlorophenolicum TaxID=46429 RepID=UPI00059BC066|nr:hypothetical protein [Sphingobium chlorophenolicum]
MDRNSATDRILAIRSVDTPSKPRRHQDFEELTETSDAKYFEALLSFLLFEATETTLASVENQATMSFNPVREQEDLCDIPHAAHSNDRSAIHEAEKIARSGMALPLLLLLNFD